MAPVWGKDHPGAPQEGYPLIGRMNPKGLITPGQGIGHRQGSTTVILKIHP